MRFDPERNNPGFSPQHNYRTLRGAFFDGIEINQRDEGGFTPLNVALDFGHQELESYLISAGADTSVIGAEFKFDPERNKEHWRGMVVEINALEEKIRNTCGKELQRSKGGTKDIFCSP